jgi:HSP20 family protein
MAESKELSVPSKWSAGVFDDFRKEMDDLIGNFFGGERRLSGSSKIWANLPAGVVNPAIDVAENDEAVTLTAELPGLAEEDVDLSFRDGVITLKGEKKYEHDEEKDDMRVSERSYGSFQRSMPVPAGVDTEKIKARFDKGVLVVTMPKKPEAVKAARKIAVEK